MKTNSQAQCANCEASYSYVEQGRREYFVPWGGYFLCDMCHRLAIMEALQIESKQPFEPPKWYGYARQIIYGGASHKLSKKGW
jgi:hypothetical protein